MNVSIRDPRTGRLELVPNFSVLISAGAVRVFEDFAVLVRCVF